MQKKSSQMIQNIRENTRISTQSLKLDVVTHEKKPTINQIQIDLDDEIKEEAL